jgi:hypothetical protein
VRVRRFVLLVLFFLLVLLGVQEEKEGEKEQIKRLKGGKRGYI